MSGEEEGLEALRERIRELDERLVRLLDERSQVSVAVGELKAASGAPVFRPEQEALLMRRLQSMRQGPLRAEHLGSIYREILSSSRDLQRQGPVAFLGPAGSFSHQAALALFGGSVPLSPSPSIEAVFRDVESGRAQMGMVPVENSIEGVVAQTLDRLGESCASICAESSLPIVHNLLSAAPLERVQRVHSHPQALGQCREWLERCLPGAEAVEAASTAAAVQAALREEGSAAIASEAAALLYGLPVLARGIEARAGNVTRFLVIGPHPSQPSGDDKTTVCFSLLDRSGALHDALLPLKGEGISMSMIQSRPIRDRNWEYVFFVDLLGHRDDEPMARALGGLQAHCARFRVLGSYPRARGA